MANSRGTKNRSTAQKRPPANQRQAPKAAPQPQAATPAPVAERTSSRAAERAQGVRDRRAERQKHYQRNKRELLILKVVGGAIAVGLILAIGFGIYQWGKDRELNREPEGVVSYQYVGAQHQEGAIDYSAQEEYQGEVPPAGGVHNPVWQNCQVYEAPVPWENAVHSLEHGAIWITYRPDLPADQIETLRSLNDDEVLISPEPLQTAPIVVTAWNRQMTAENANDQEIRRFIRFFKNTPEGSQEYAASCTSNQTTTRPG